MGNQSRTHRATRRLACFWTDVYRPKPATMRINWTAFLVQYIKHALGFLTVFRLLRVMREREELQLQGAHLTKCKDSGSKGQESSE